MAEYRPVPEDREDDWHRVAQYAFDAPSGPYDPDEELEGRLRRMWSFGEDRGMFEGADLQAVCHHFEFPVTVRGVALVLGGLSAVATPPEHRRKGLVEEMMAASLAEYRDRGWPLSALRPFDEAFYARYGWETGCRYRVATVDASALAVTEDAAAGEFRRIHPDEYERLRPVYESWLDGVNLATRRSDDWWRDRTFQSREQELFCYAWERDGDPRGYLLYRVEEDGDERRLQTHEMAYADHEAYVNLLRFCYYHDPQLSEVELYGPFQDRLLDVVRDRDAVEVREAAGQMVRVVDVPAALEAIPFPGVGAAEVTLAVDDGYAPWNDATFALRVSDGEATVEETDADPDASLGVGTLSQLFVGYLPVDRAREVGDLRIHSGGTAETLAALFPERPTFLPESF